ncbi:hypothetical protein CDAR_368241 [Caerostris darwini]|uniref:Uncharacterized protein n=1 Tax=Caerostris darwini TaxID=1538125 RepID=A0AAV4WEE1_9ARAC|nr:hypothetical protein CDAR_368241 [Caerostris darwini]
MEDSIRRSNQTEHTSMSNLMTADYCRCIFLALPARCWLLKCIFHLRAGQHNAIGGIADRTRYRYPLYPVPWGFFGDHPLIPAGV